MDPVEKLFKDLPSPAAEKAALDQTGVWDQAHFGRVFMSFLSAQSRDPDHEFVAKWAQSFMQTQNFEGLRSEIGQFALSKLQIPNDGSAKSQQLKFHAWISQGRKDEEYPFKDEGCAKEQPVGPPEGGHAFLPTDLTGLKICAKCGKPDAKFACSGCLVKQESHVVMGTAYCDTTCQAQHWEDHKSQCLGRRKICRAVSLVYDLFILFQKMAWINKHVAGIAEKHGITNIIHSEHNEWQFQGNPFLCRFPSGIFPSQEHALAVLLDSECQQLLSTCKCILSLLLLPLCQTLQEVQIMARNAYRPTCDLKEGAAYNTMYSQHTVLCATLKSGEQMAVDIAGAQFGWRETVAPWGVWTRHRAAGKPCPQPFGSAEQCMQMLYPLVAGQYVGFIESQRSSLALKMRDAIQNKMKENKVSSARELYKLGDTAFASCKLAMLSSAEEALENGLRELHESKLGFCYLDARGAWRATATKQQAEALEGVWLTDEDVKKAKAKGTDLRIVYQLRCKDQVNRRKFKAAGLNMP